MPAIHPFCGLRPDPAQAAKLISLPYDIVGRQEARRLADNKPFSFLRVTRADLEFPDHVNPYAEQIYERARQNLNDLIEKKILFFEDKKCYYIYRINFQDQKQTGLVGLFSVKDYFQGYIKKHELTRPKKEQDRIRHIQHLQAHTGPVFLLYRKQQASGLTQLLDAYADDHSPLYDLDFAGARHRLYRLDAEDTACEIEDAFARLPCVYIADGHHRAASAAQAALQAKEQLGEGGSRSDRFLAVAFPDTQIQIRPYYRVVRDLNGLSREDFLQALRAQGLQVQKGQHSSLSDCQANVFLENACYKLEWDLVDLSGQNAVTALPASFLQEKILSPLLGITDPRTSERIAFIAGVHGERELERLVAQKEFKVAFSLAAVQPEQLLAVADAGQVMPPKSTWFEPKLCSGLIVHAFR